MTTSTDSGKQTQCQRIASWLRRNGSIDPITAWRKLGIYRLGARIYDLRQQGWEIRTIRHGTMRHAVYIGGRVR